MHKYYRDYYWKEGVPCGRGVIDASESLLGDVFKIISDPYRKRFSVEKYSRGKFMELTYDSALFDFRLLKPMEQNAWQKETIEEDENHCLCLIRNGDDRVIVKEFYYFNHGRCSKCIAQYPNGEAISTQIMYYKVNGSAFNGVILFDRNDHPIVYKEYEVDEASGEFSELIKEVWNMEEASSVQELYSST